jgi:hypothetical protein
MKPSVSWEVDIDYDDDDHHHVDGGEIMSLNCGNQRPYCSSPRWNMNMENHSVMMMSTEGNSWFLRQSFLAIVPADSSGSKREEWAKWRKIWPYKVLFSYLQVISAYRKTLRHGAFGLKEGVLRIFIGLKNLSPRPGLNPQTLGPIANTPNITLPWRLLKKLINVSENSPPFTEVDVSSPCSLETANGSCLDGEQFSAYPAYLTLILIFYNLLYVFQVISNILVLRMHFSSPNVVVEW